jgi:hypothetical protein
MHAATQGLRAPLAATMAARHAPRRAMPALFIFAALLAAATRGATGAVALPTSVALPAAVTLPPGTAATAPVAAVAVAGPVPSALPMQGVQGPTAAPVLTAQAPAAGVSAWVEPDATGTGGVQQFGMWTPGRLAQIMVAVILLVLVCFFMIVRCARGLACCACTCMHVTCAMELWRMRPQSAQPVWPLSHGRA